METPATPLSPISSKKRSPISGKAADTRRKSYQEEGENTDSGKIATLQAKLQEAYAEISSLQLQAVQRKQETSDESSRMLSTMRKKLRDANAEISTAQQALMDVGRQDNKETSQLLEKEVERLTAKNVELEGLLSDSRRMATESALEAKNEISRLMNKCEDLETHLRIANSEVSKATTQILHLEHDLRRTRTEKQILEVEASQEAITVETLAPSNDTSTVVSEAESSPPAPEEKEGEEDIERRPSLEDENIRMVRDLQSKIEARRQEKADLRAKVQELQHKFAQQARQADTEAKVAAETALEMKDKHNSVVSVIREEMRHQEATYRSKLEQLEAKLSQTSLAEDALRHKCERFESTELQLKLELSHMSNANKKLTKQLAETETRLMESSLSEIENEIRLGNQGKHEMEMQRKKEALKRMNREKIIWTQNMTRSVLVQLREAFQTHVKNAYESTLEEFYRDKRTAEALAEANAKSLEAQLQEREVDLASARLKVSKHKSWLAEATDRMVSAERRLKEDAAERKIEQAWAAHKVSQYHTLEDMYRVLEEQKSKLERRLDKGQQATEAYFEIFEGYAMAEIESRELGLMHGRKKALERANEMVKAKLIADQKEQEAEKAKVDAELKRMSERLEETSSRLRAEEAAKAHTSRLMTRIQSLEEALELTKFEMESWQFEANGSRREAKLQSLKRMRKELNAIFDARRRAYLMQWLRNARTA